MDKSPQIRLDRDNDDYVSEDLAQSTRVRASGLSHLPGFEDDFSPFVREKLLELAEGTFLWVGFAMIELLRKKTNHAI